MAGLSSRALATSPENRLHYNGKEEQRREFSDGSGLELLDYGARMYDAQIGRWQMVDPLAAKFLSQTTYCGLDNNPINIIDPTGKSGQAVIDKDGKTITISANLIFYGASGSSELATKAADNIQK